MWNYLKTVNKPVVLYGTGNGAEKIANELTRRGIKISGVFASDSFVRSKVFMDCPVTSYADAKARFGDMVVLVCFGTDRPELMAHIDDISKEQELYFPDVPVYGGGVFDREYYELHKAELDNVRALLADEQSIKVFDSVIEYKLSGKPSFIRACETPESENWSLLNLTQTEQYLDLGAYTGDTVAEFVKAAGSYDAIYAFEPDARNFRKLTENTAGLENVELYNLAVNDKRETLQFLKNSGRGSAAKSGKTVDVQADSVDNVLNQKHITVIKMDVEGQEAKAIEGAKLVISRDKPKMMIAAYHRNEDLFAIPMQIFAINPDYKLYLRHSPCLPAWELNYFFVS